MNKAKKRAVSALLVIIFALSFAAPAYADDTVHIKTADDLISLAESCARDTWSSWKTVELDGDISLDGTAFTPIPYFDGTFNGNGHTVSGLDIEGKYSRAGLFGVIGENGTVKNLTVCGTLYISGTTEAAGGIAAVNNGHIIACRFTGTVSGSASTGGIAGKNAVTGGIYGCTVSGAVYGESMTGGIAGYNLGLISACRSSAYVNTASRDKTFSVADISVDVSTDLAKLSARSADEPAASDTGGIAGYSAGIIRGCVNEATVGYRHVGYNVGGIAGRSCGYMISCTNSGEVYGRKDVGGIVGQMEPYTQLSLTDGSLATMQRQLNELNAIINQTAYDAAGSGSAVSSRLDVISAYVDRAIAEADNIDINIGGGDGEEQPEISYDPDTGIEIPDYSGGYDIVVTPDISGLTSALSAINGQLSLLNGEMSAAGGAVANDIIAANAKFNELMNSVFSAIYSVGTSASGIITDTSAVNIADVRLGKVYLSENTGAVSGDINVGGVAGAIATEQVLDPEDDLSPEISAENKREYELKAVLTECTNHGAVSALRSCAGSVAGRTELGIVTLCCGYGDVTSDSGDYVGGIVGLTSASVRSNWAKCTLSGGKYVGGIVGSGTEETLTGAGSTVAGNVSMVAIADAAQYYGAISGADAGDYAENRFVSDTLAGIDGVSYAGRADRMSYAALCVLPGCPDDMRRLTLTFEADGEVIKKVSFNYGASFGADVYPAIPAKDGYSGHWDITELRSLHLDTRVTAVYDRERTAISADTQRGGRSIVLVEGAYAPTDSVTDSDSTVTGAPGNVLEQRHIILPSDGQSTHTVHYLPPEVTSGGVAVYVTQNGRWTRADTESFGSYLAFTVEGDEFDLAAVAEGGSARIIMAAAGAIAAAALITALIITLRRRRGAIGGAMNGIKKPAKTDIMDAEVFPAEGAEKQKNPRRKRLVILAVCLVLLAGIAGAAFALLPKVSGVLTPYRALTSLCKSPQLEMNISVDTTVGGTELEAGIPVSVGTFDGVRVTCAQLGSAPLYFAEDMLILENGKAYALGSSTPDYGALPAKLAAVYKDVDVSADEDGNYSLTVGAEQADALLRTLCPELGSDSLAVGSAVLTLKLTDGAVERIALTADGELRNGTAFTVSAVIDGIVCASSLTLPEAVSAAIASSDAGSLDTLTGEVMNVISAWSALSSRESVTGRLALRADCGPVVLNTTLDVSSTLTDGKRSYRIGKNDIGIDIDGSGGESGEQSAAKYIELIDVVYLACISGDVTSRSTASGTVYTMALDSDSIERIVSIIAPEAETLGAVFSSGTAELTVTNGEIGTVSLSCTGTMKVVLTETAVSISAELTVE